jgi:hypothetical protein
MMCKNDFIGSFTKQFTDSHFSFINLLETLKDESQLKRNSEAFRRVKQSTNNRDMHNNCRKPKAANDRITS